MVEYGCKIEKKKKGKAMQSEIKENLPGSHSEGKEIRTQIDNLEQKKKINI